MDESVKISLFSWSQSIIGANWKLIFSFFSKVFEPYKDHILDLNSPYTHRAMRVANRLFLANKNIPEVEAIKWKLTVIENPKNANALAFPGGDLIIFTGLLEFVKNDDELAVVLAHEMSHVRSNSTQLNQKCLNLIELFLRLFYNMR